MNEKQEKFTVSICTIFIDARCTIHTTANSCEPMKIHYIGIVFAIAYDGRERERESKEKITKKNVFMAVFWK